MKTIHVRGVCSQSGFGVATVGLIRVLMKAGYDVKFIPVNALPTQHRKGFSDEELKFMDDLTVENPTGIDILFDVGSLVFALSIPPMECNRSFLYTTTETTNIHPEYTYMLNNKYDEIWTASNFNKTGFLTSGVHNKINVLPHYIDVDRYNPDVPPLKIKNLREFNFVMNIDFSFRKGLHLALPAWLETFEKDDDVALLLKISNGNFGLDKVQAILQPLQNMIYQMGFDAKEHAPVLLYLDSIPSNYMPNFYKSGQCYLSPNLGEGFGLPIAESMACGIPQIVSRCGAPLDYVNRRCGYFIDLHEKKPTQPVKDPSLLQRDPRYKGTSIFNLNTESLSEHMRYCYMNQSEMEEKGAKARDRVIKKLSLDVVADKAKAFLEDTGEAEEISL